MQVFYVCVYVFNYIYRLGMCEYAEIFKEFCTSNQVPTWGSVFCSS